DIVVSATHDGYRSLPGRPLHRRQWRLVASRLEIADTIEGAGRHHAVARLHFHPALRLRRLADHVFQVSDLGGNAVARVIADHGAASSVKQSSYHPEFGSSQDNWVLESTWQR